METIKTIIVDGRLHVLRQGNAVSCSCCDQECCLYSAQALIDGLYGIADLPQTVVAYGQDGGYQVTFTKTNSSPAYYEGDTETQTRIVINQDGEVASWELQTFEEQESEWSSFQDTSPNACLIFEPLAENLAFVGDEFEQSYQVETIFSTGTVTRTSLCTWEGQDGNGCPLFLFYNGGGIDAAEETRHKWALTFSNFISERGCETSYVGVKQNNQSSPAGEYQDLVDVGATATVSAA